MVYPQKQWNHELTMVLPPKTVKPLINHGFTPRNIVKPQTNHGFTPKNIVKPRINHGFTTKT